MLNYIGPDDGQGIKMFYDGAEVASDTSKTERSNPVREGRIVVGRTYTDKDEAYGSVQVDELIYFNQALIESEIKAIYKSVG